MQKNPVNTRFLNACVNLNTIEIKGKKRWLGEKLGETYSPRSAFLACIFDDYIIQKTAAQYTLLFSYALAFS